jgi:hypothetical protein
LQTDPKSVVTIFDGTVLVGQGEENTMIRFSLDERMRVVPGSVHALPIRLRSR